MMAVGITRGGPCRRRFSGRVEHLSSGESMRFSLLTGLLRFFAAALDAAAAGATTQGDHDHHKSNLLSDRS